jgi:hypothetical protein
MHLGPEIVALSSLVSKRKRKLAYSGLARRNVGSFLFYSALPSSRDLLRTRCMRRERDPD